MGSRVAGKGAAGGAMIVALVHCASLSGLDQYMSCAGCDDAGSDAAAQVQTAPEPDATAIPPEPDTGTEAVPDVSEVPVPADDSSPVPEGEAGAPDTGVDAAHGPSDAGGHDAAADAPSCSSASCGGCCTAGGLCAAGGLTSACGMGGATCQNCAASSLVCSGRTCVAPVADAGPVQTGCMPATCANLCVPYFVQCCKPDQTCGCALLYPPGTCN